MRPTVQKDSEAMKGKGIGKSAKSSGVRVMYTQALLKARDWYDQCMDAEYRGRKDKNGSARARLADFLGVSESKLLRLEYKLEEMRDVAGELYRRLELGYKALCEHNEAAAEELRQERLELRAKRHAANSGVAPSSNGVGSDDN